MLIKKLGAIAATGALLLAVAAPAFANDNTGVYVTNNGNVNVTTGTTANSGFKGIAANGDDAYVQNVNITSGAASASVVVGTELNNNYVNVTAGDEGTHVHLTNNGNVTVESTTLANSGFNGVIVGDDSSVSQVNVTSGAASASTNVQSLVNVNSVTVNAAD